MTPAELPAELPADWIDLSRYPVSPPDAALVARGREQLRARGACVLPGFLRPQAVAALVAEAEGLAPLAYHSTVEGNAYLEPGDPALPPDHPRQRTETTTLGAVAYDQIPPGAALRRLYEWDPLLAFLAALLGKERLYRYADPMGALNLAVMGEGDYLRWHFDQTDFVVSIALQAAEQGGDFEYAPLIRGPGQENYAAVSAVLDGVHEVERLPMDPGALVLFEGRHSIHRVTRVHGPRLRLVALLGYDTRPGVQSTEHLRRMRYGRA